MFILLFISILKSGTAQFGGYNGDGGGFGGGGSGGGGDYGFGNGGTNPWGQPSDNERISEFFGFTTFFRQVIITFSPF